MITENDVFVAFLIQCHVYSTVLCIIGQFKGHPVVCTCGTYRKRSSSLLSILIIYLDLLRLDILVPYLHTEKD